MKRVFILFLLVFLVNGCDDGNLTLETIDFEQVAVQSCVNNDILFKLKGSEALQLEISKSNFINEPTDPDSPIVLDISTTKNRVVYHFYDGEVSNANICNTIQPAKPVIIDQWLATAGKIEITTAVTPSPGNITGSTRITGYSHNIIFRNITFEKNDGSTIRYETLVFGNYVTTVEPLPFGFDKIVEQCPISKQVYNFTSGESFTIEKLDETLIVDKETPLNSPRTALIGPNNNRLIYRQYSGLLSPSFFCNTVPPASPLTITEWAAVPGVVNTSGVIEVSTIKSGTKAFQHTIVIKKATLKNGKNTFLLGDSYIYGELITF